MAESLISSRSKRQPKKRALDDGSSSLDKRYRKCENSGCPSERPVCCAELSNGCCGDGYTSRWYHISDGEHFCNACFDHMYRSHKEGYEAYAKWKFEWGGTCQREASTKTYVAETVMAFWIKCVKCGKWRSLPRTEGDLTPELAKRWYCKPFTTGKKAKTKGPNPCDLPEDERVSRALSPGWLSSLFEPPLLKNSPAAPYLKSYFSDGVGLSPILNEDEEKNEANANSCCTGYLQPFYNPDIGVSAFTFRPDTMEQDEQQNFPLYASTREGSIIYLTLRNLILALWASGCKECLTKEKCANHIITRGLVRIPLIQETEHILRYLSIKGIVNHGIIDNIAPSLSDQKLSVIVIGAGASGLSAARHLSKFGVKVTVLEARDRIGGRVHDDYSLGCCVGRGAQILTGCINNPISVLSEQLGLTMKHISGHCDLLDERGKAADINVDKKVEFHFNAILDAIAEWRKGKTCKEDLPLEDRIQEMHKLFLEETQLEFSEEENQLLQFHLGNLEYACAAPLGKVSALHWDQNDAFPQFVGDHTLLVQGCGALLKGLSKDLNIMLNCHVSEISYSQGKVAITTKKGTRFIAHKAIVTLPLAVLKSGLVKFTPELPTAKLDAIKNLGAGLIEKVAMKFSRNFWSQKVQGANFFGRIPSSSDSRASCGIFYDLSKKGSSPKKCNVLMTVLSGELASKVHNMKDEQIINQIVDILKKLFPEETIPKPEKYLVSRWGPDQYAGMAYSFVPLGSSGQEYDEMASTVDKMLYFAGEASNRQFPQTVTGAYLSGIREAEKILFQLFDES